MHELLNTLYIQTQGAALRLDYDTVQVRVQRENRLRVPLLRLESIVVFGRVGVTGPLIHRCAEEGRSLVWMSRSGRFRARLVGPTGGNVLLRRAQHLALSEPAQCSAIARQMVAAKIQNSRNQLLRAARDVRQANAAEALTQASTRMAAILARLRALEDIDELRGAEGEAAMEYFGVFDHMITAQRDAFNFDGRNRRPPRDRTNAVLSFLYALLANECSAALEAVGLDSQVGYLHALRPGRSSLALDLMEEFRAPLADRLTLTLINRRQLQPKHFEDMPGGAVYLNEEGRRALLVAYQERKQAEVEHRTLKNKVPLGLVPHIQARLLARHLRGDLKHYPPFIYR
jgi:CRISPR-associated protein Cas1